MRASIGSSSAGRPFRLAWHHRAGLLWYFISPVLLPAGLQAASCELYPIALHTQTLAGKAPGDTLNNIYQGGGPGNFSWLTWAGSPSEPTLVRSLTPPGDSHTYVNPDHLADRTVSTGDWVQGKPGVSNSKHVREALDALKLLDIVVPVWDQAQGQGSNLRYRVTAFARVRLLSYQLPGQNRITARFLGYAACDSANQPPVASAGPDITITLPEVAVLNGSVTDDGLPGGTLSVLWSYISGPAGGQVGFANPNSASTTASFTLHGVYVLRLTASDGEFIHSDDMVVTVNRPNQPPSAFPQTVETDEDTPVAIVLQGADPDGDPITFEVVSQPPYGRLSGTPPNLLFTPIADWNGTSSFTFKVHDGQLSSPDAVVTIVVRPVNDPPVADALALTNAEDQVLTVLLSGSDVEGSPLGFTVLSFPTNGVLSAGTNGFTYLYTPNSNFHGLDHFTYRANDGELDSAPALVSLTITNINDAPEVDAGPDQIVTLPVTNVNLAGVVVDDWFLDAPVVSWAKVSGPGEVVFADASAPVTAATFPTSGVHVLRLTADDGFFLSSDEVTVTINVPPLVDAGPARMVTLPDTASLAGVVADDGLPVDGQLTVLWEKVSGPGTVIFGNPTNAITTAAFGEGGLYVLRLTASDGLAGASAEVAVLVNRAPTVDAGPDQVFSGLETALAGSAADDGLPQNTLTAAWSKVSGPGEVTFTPVGGVGDTQVSLFSTAVFSAPGVYVLALTADDSLASRADTLTVTVNDFPVAQPQAVVTTEDTPLAITLTATDQFGGPLTFTLLNAPTNGTLNAGVGALGSPQLLYTPRTNFHGPDAFVFMVHDGFTSSAPAAVTIAVTPVNAPPQVGAGADQTIRLPANAALNCTVTDDGKPAGSALLISWSALSGPGPVLFDNASSPLTTARFSQPGVYVLNLGASDGAAVGTDTLTVVVEPVGGNQAPVVSAAADLNVGWTNAVTLNGNVTDDGFPLNARLLVNWSLVSGPGGVTFAETNHPVTLATFSAPGSYTLSLAASDTEFVSADTVVVTIYPDNFPPVVSAGPDTNGPVTGVTLPGAVSDDGRPAGAPLAVHWTKISGPGGVTFNATNTPLTTASFTAEGAYVLRLTASDSQFTVLDEVSVTVGGNGAPVVDAGPDQSVELVSATPGAAFTNAVAVNDQWIPDIGQPGLDLWPSVDGLAWVNGKLAVSGNFRTAGGQSLPAHAFWTGCGWERLPAGITFLTTASQGHIEGFDGQLYVTGGSPFITGFGGTTHGRVRWDGTNWHDWPFSLTPSSVLDTFALVQVSDGVLAMGLLDGQPTVPPLIPSQKIIKWDGAGWVGLGGGVTGGSINMAAQAPDGSIYVTGQFTHAGGIPASSVARWDGTNWHALGSGLGNCVGFACQPVGNSIAIAPNGDVFVTGNFTSAGGVPVSHIARWDGTNWHSLGSGLNSLGLSMAFRGSNLFVGGEFGTAGGVTARHIARWDGMNWHALGGGANHYVITMVNTPSGLYVGGYFTLVNGQPANYIAKWGFREPPTIECPPPVVASSSGGADATVTLAANVGHPCGNAVTVTWNVDGGAPEYVVTIPAGVTSPPQTVAFTHSYPVGSHTVTITADDGVSPPVTCTTSVVVTSPAAITLNGSVTDDGLPAGGGLQAAWTVVSGPGPVPFGSTSNAVTTAFFNLAGTYVLRLAASDSQFSDEDDVIVTVVPAGVPNLPPSVSAGLDRSVDVNLTTTLNGTASDDGRPTNSLTLQWSQISGPGAAIFDAPDQATTAVGFTQPGIYVLRLTASDGDLSTFDEVVVTVTGSLNQPPVANAGPDLVTALPGKVRFTQATATDDGLPFGVLVRDWSQVNGPGTALLIQRDGVMEASFPTNGSYVFRLTADDGRLTHSDDVMVTVHADTPPPVVEIVSPLDAGEITAPTPVIGTVTSLILQSFELQYRLKPSQLETPDPQLETWVTLASGSTNVVNGTLGVLDPTLSLNGIYEFRLVATDLAGRVTATEPNTTIFDRNMKVGHFSFSFSDLNVPVAGIPIEIIRTYDSRDRRVGDFGVGWTLGIKNIRLQKNRNLGANWFQDTTGGFFPTYFLDPRKERRVTVTFPDGRVFKFTANLAPESQFGVPINAGVVTWQPSPDTHGTLESVRGDDVSVAGAVPGFVDFVELDTGALYNPTLFRLTTHEGDVYVIDERDGLQSLTDRHGNTLTITADGILWTGADELASKSITFTRDADGRINGITDPAGNVLTYAYDAQGDLVTFTDRENQSSHFTYDGTHRLLTFTDPRGVTPLRNEYDDAGRLVRQVDGNGQVTQFTHDLNNRLEIVRDRLGHVTLHEYDLNGNVTRMIDPLGHQTLYTHDALDNQLTKTDALGNVTAWTYDLRGNKLTETDGVGTTRWTYDAFNQITSVTDPRGHTSTNHYDPDTGNLTRTVDALGHATEFTYDGLGNLLTLTDALGHVTENAYDTTGNLTNVVVRDVNLGMLNVTAFAYDANGNQTNKTTWRTTPQGAQALVTAFIYDAENRLVQSIYPDGSTAQTVYNAIDKPVMEIDPLGRQTVHEYDAQGNLTKTTFPDGRFELMSFDAENRKVSVTDRAGRLMTYGYDALARMTNTVYADGSITNLVLDALGRLIAAVDERGNTNRFAYDPNCGCAGRQTKTTDALGRETHFGYDSGGNQISLTDALGRVTFFVSDALDRRTQTVFPDGTFTTSHYDALGRRVAETDQAGVSTWFGYDVLGRLTSVTNALGGVTRYAYDEAGNLVAQTDANGHTTTYEYDPMGRRTRRTLPGGQVETYAYDLAGNLTSQTDFNGFTTTLTYDALDRLLTKVPDARRGEPAISFTYTATGRRASMTDASGVTTYAYDLRDRLAQKTWLPAGQASGLSLTYSRDIAGNLTCIQSSTPGGTDVGYEYDALNRLSAVNDSRRGRTEYAFDAVGNLAGYAYPNGVTTTHQFDALNRLTNLVVRNAQLSTLNRFTYTLHSTGHRLSVAELSGRAASYTYDALYRLTGETVAGAPDSGSASYTLDAVGNRLQRSSSLAGVANQALAYDANDRLLSDQYDPNGNTVAGRVSPSTPLVADEYDFENRLINRNSGQVLVVYDGDGNRVAKTVNGVTTLYLVDDQNLTGYAQVLEELTTGLGPQPSVFRLYGYGLDLISKNHLLDDGQGDAAWRASFYGYDGHGSVRFLTDENGQVTDSYDYDAFGNLIAQATIFPTPTPNAYRYAGEQFDEDLGLYYNRARYLNTDSGRFWTPDKFEGLQELGDSLNHYTYVRANPVSRTDPSGHFEFTLAGLSITVQHIGYQERQEAEKARRNYNLARRGLCYGGAKGIEHLHHALPWFLGGKDQGSNLIRIPGEEHMKLHQMLHWALKAAMLPGTASDDVYQDLFRGKDGKLERELVHKIVLAVSRDFDKRCKKHLGYAITPKVEEQIRNKQWDF